MKFIVDKKERYTVFEVLEDKLNTLIAPELKTELTLLHNEGIKNIILNLKNVAFVDSSGLSAILVGNRLCTHADGIFVVAEITDNVKRLMKISQLDSILQLIPTVVEARDYVMMTELMKELNGTEDLQEAAEEEEGKEK